MLYVCVKYFENYHVGQMIAMNYFYPHDCILWHMCFGYHVSTQLACSFCAVDTSQGNNCMYVFLCVY